MARTALPRDLLRRPAAEGARLVALTYLDQAAAAFPRLNDPSEGEALHDFRVAVRRLRSTLRAYRPLFAGSVRKKARRRLRELGDRTNAGRDVEVQLAWLREQTERLSRREQVGLGWFVNRLEERRASEHGAMLAAVEHAFPRAAQQLRRRLREYRAQVPPAGSPAGERFAAAASTAVLATAAAFGDALAAVGDPADPAPAHAARIAGKRVRYVLEPLEPFLPTGGSLVRRLKSLQDLLGELNDCHVLAADVAAAAAAAGAARARQLHELALADDPAARGRARRGPRDPRGGLLAIARLLQQRRRDLFARLEEEWLADGGKAFAAELQEAATALASRRRPRAAPRGPTPAPPPGIG